MAHLQNPIHPIVPIGFVHKHVAVRVGFPTPRMFHKPRHVQELLGFLWSYIRIVSTFGQYRPGQLVLVKGGVIDVPKGVDAGIVLEIDVSVGFAKGDGFGG